MPNPTLYDNFSQVKQYIDQNQVDLSSYVSKTELANASYVTNNTLNSYLSTDNFTKPAGFDTVKLWDTGLSVSTVNGKIYPDWLSYSAVNGSTYNYSFISGGTLKNFINGRLANIESTYATTSYVADYVAEHGGGGSTTIDENIIPKENNTYTLGDESHLYSATYSSRLKVGNNSQIYNDGGGITLSVNSNAGIRMGSSNFYPKNNKGMNLGQSSNAWNNTYTSNIYADTVYLQDTSYTKSIVPAETATYTLGDSNHIYSNTYSRGVYLGTGIRMFSESSAASTDMAISLGGVSYFYLNTNRFAPNGAANNGKLDLGAADRKWNHIYGKSVNADATYTANLYADTIHNFIWTGTSAEYAALPDYTTYQIYMIKEG